MKYVDKYQTFMQVQSKGNRNFLLLESNGVYLRNGQGNFVHHLGNQFFFLIGSLFEAASGADSDATYMDYGDMNNNLFSQLSNQLSSDWFGVTLNTDTSSPKKKSSPSEALVERSIPFMEISKLIGSIINLKAQIVSRIYHLIQDNADLIRGIRDIIFNKISTIHDYTLKGIVILRKIIEFAVNLFGNWQVPTSVSAGDLDIDPYLNALSQKDFYNYLYLNEDDED